MAGEELMMANYGEEEIDVAAILLELPRLIMERELSSLVSFNWGSKRKRSLLQENDNSRRNRAGDTSPPPQEAAAATATAAEAKAEASSPATPLSFSPSESDGKRKPSKRKSHRKRKREEWLAIIEELTARKELMKREINNVSRYYDKLKAFNLELKAKTKELINVELGQTLNMVGQLELHQTNNHLEIRHQPLIFCDAIIPTLRDLPDLNAPVDESFAMDSLQPLDSSAMANNSWQPLDSSAMANNNRDMSRIMASEARRKRIQIYRVKNSVAANRLRYPC